MTAALALLTVPATAVAQDGSAAGGSPFGPLGPSAPSSPPAEDPPQPQQPPQPLPQAPVTEASDEMLGTTEVLVFVAIEALLLGALSMAIAREGRGIRRAARRGRHSRRAQPPRRKRGAVHLPAEANAPPPPPRRRRAKARAGRR